MKKLFLVFLILFSWALYHYQIGIVHSSSWNKTGDHYIFIPFNTSFNPADSTSYFVNALHGTVPTSQGTENFIFVPTGTVTKVCIVFNRSVAASGELVTVTVRKSINPNTSADTTMVFTYAWDNNSTTCSSGNAFSVTETDFINIRIDTPAWVTNPTGVKLGAKVYIQG